MLRSNPDTSAGQNLRKLPMSIKSFLRAEDGAVTVDHVVLTSAIIGLSFVVVGAISGGTKTLAGSVVDHVEAVEVGAMSTAAAEPDATEEEDQGPGEIVRIRDKR